MKLTRNRTTSHPYVKLTLSSRVSCWEIYVSFTHTILYIITYRIMTRVDSPVQSSWPASIA